jgi:adenylate kinase
MIKLFFWLLLQAEICSSSRMARPPRIVVIGPPGSGKGTLCKAIQNKMHLVHISAGDILRASLNDQSISADVKNMVNKGNLVPDDLIISVVKSRVQTSDSLLNGWLIDGFPRTQKQAIALCSEDEIFNPDCVILLNINKPLLLQRITGRRVDPVTGTPYHIDDLPKDLTVRQRLVIRPDDSPQLAMARYDDYVSRIQSIKEALARFKLIELDGSKPMVELLDDLENVFKPKA